MFDRLIVEIVGLVGSLVLRALYATLRIEWHSSIDQTSAPKAVLVFWHSRQLMMPWVRRTYVPQIAVLISAHRDGRMIARAIEYLGLLTVAGSSTRGGTAAMMLMRESLQAGNSIAITPDGPRGPVHKVKPGAVRLAQLTGVPIYPLAFGAARAWRFKSWDRMLLPKPFSRCAFAVGDPIHVPSELSDEQFTACCEHVEQKLNEVTALADDFR